MVRKGLMEKMTLEQMRRFPTRSEGPNYVTILGKSVSDRGNSKCKDPEVGTCLACLRKSKDCSMVGAEEKIGDEV